MPATVAMRQMTMVPPGAERLVPRVLMLGVFFSGWSLLRVGSINLTLSDLACLLALAIVAGRGRLSLMAFGGLTTYWIVGLTLMLGGLLASSLINGDPLRWLSIGMQYIVAFLLLPILLMQHERSLAVRLPLVFAFGTVLSEAIGIVASALFTYHDTLHWLGDGFITGNARLGAMAGQPNPNGAMVAFSVPMLIHAWRRGTIGARVAVPCLLILVWGLVLSASFTGFFATVAAVIGMMALLGVRYMARFGVAVMVALGLFVASGAPLPPAFQKRVGTAVQQGDISEAGTYLNRADLIKEAWRFAESNAVIGMGVDQYREISAYDNPVHNLYLLIWNEGGFIAFLGLMTLLTLLIVQALGGLKIHREDGALACAVVFVFIVYTMSYPHMYSRSWTMPVMVALAAIYAGRRAPGSA